MTETNEVIPITQELILAQPGYNEVVGKLLQDPITYSQVTFLTNNNQWSIRNLGVTTSSGKFISFPATAADEQPELFNYTFEADSGEVFYGLKVIRRDSSEA